MQKIASNYLFLATAPILGQAPSKLYNLIQIIYFMQQLSGLDSSFLYLEMANTPMHVGGLNVYEGSLTFDEFRDFLAERLHLAPRCILNHPVSSRRMWNSALLSLDRIKKLRVAVEGCTLKDVVLAICTGALRRYLLEKDELPDKPLVAMIPVNTRSKTEKGDMGNQVSAMLIQLPTDTDNPIDQLRQLYENTKCGKSYQNAIGAKQMTDYAEFIPFALEAGASRLYTRMHVSKMHRPVFNLVITNVPGSQIPLYMNGKLMLANMGVAPIFDGMGLIIPVLSYNGVLSFSPTTVFSIMPDVDLFTKYIRESANTLEQCVIDNKK